MHQVPTAVWNEIAESQPLSEPWATLFRMKDEELEQGLETLVDNPAEAAGADNRTVLAYRLTAPLLVENEAISSYLQETQRMDLRTSLPELVSVNEAVMLASEEYRLSDDQQAKLRYLLTVALIDLDRPERVREALPGLTPELRQQAAVIALRKIRARKPPE